MSAFEVKENTEELKAGSEDSESDVLRWLVAQTSISSLQLNGSDPSLLSIMRWRSAHLRFQQQAGPPAKLPTLGVDWNGVFQQKLLDTAVTPSEQKDRLRGMRAVVSGFLQAASDLAVLIVSELHVNEKLKLLKRRRDLPGVAGGDHFLHDNIFLKLVSRSSDAMQIQLYPSLVLAQKAAGCEVRAINAVIEAGVEGLSPLLSTTIRVGSHVIFATARAPVQATLTQDQKSVRLAEALGQHLHLAPHSICKVDGTISRGVALSEDVEIHLGTDSRYYILDLARLLPPCPPSALLDAERTAVLMCYQFRPEFLRQFCPVPLSSDALSPMAQPVGNPTETALAQLMQENRTHDDNIEVAKKKLYGSVLRTIARHLDRDWTLDEPLSTPDPATALASDADDVPILDDPVEIVDSGSGHIEEPSERGLGDAEVFRPDSLLMNLRDQPVVTLLHRYGANLRQLADIRNFCKHRIPRGLLLMHMVARSVRRLFRHCLQKHEQLHGVLPAFIVRWAKLMFNICRPHVRHQEGDWVYQGPVEEEITGQTASPSLSDSGIDPFWVAVREELQRKYGSECVSDTDWTDFLTALAGSLTLESPSTAEEETKSGDRKEAEVSQLSVEMMAASHVWSILRTSLLPILPMIHVPQPLPKEARVVRILQLRYLLLQSEEEILRSLRVLLMCIVKPIARVALLPVEAKASEGVLLKRLAALPADGSAPQSELEPRLAFLHWLRDQTYASKTPAAFQVLCERGAPHVERILMITDAIVTTSSGEETTSTASTRSSDGSSSPLMEVWSAWQGVVGFLLAFRRFDDSVALARRCLTLSESPTFLKGQDLLGSDYQLKALQLLIRACRYAQQHQQCTEYALLLLNAVIDETRQISPSRRLELQLTAAEGLLDSPTPLQPSVTIQLGELLQRAYQLSNSADIEKDSSWRWMAGRLQGKYQHQQKQKPQAVDSYQYALNTAKPSYGLEKGTVMILHMEMAVACLLNDEEERSREHYKEAMAFPVTYANVALLTPIIEELWIAYGKKEPPRLDSAIEVLTDAISRVMQIEDPPYRSYVPYQMRILGGLYSVVGKQEQAAACFLQSLHLYLQLLPDQPLSATEQMTHCSDSCHNCQAGLVQSDRTPFVAAKQVVELYELLSECCEDLTEYCAAFSYRSVALHLTCTMNGSHSRQLVKPLLTYQACFDMLEADPLEQLRFRVGQAVTYLPPQGENRLVKVRYVDDHAQLADLLATRGQWSEAEGILLHLLDCEYEETAQQQSTRRRCYNSLLEDVRSRREPWMGLSVWERIQPDDEVQVDGNGVAPQA